MRSLFSLLILLFVSQWVVAGELEQAYQKEYAYLVSEKRALQQRLTNLKTEDSQSQNKLQESIAALQKRFLQLQNQTDRLNRQIADASRNAEFAENDTLLLDTTIGQARESMNKLDHPIAEQQAKEDQLRTAITSAIGVMNSDGELSQETGQFFLSNGESVEGEILKIGRIARFGISEEGGGILAPSGNRQFKVWDPKTLENTRLLNGNLYPQSIDIFLYESADQAIEKKAETTFADDVDAGGLVGKVIIALGIVGVLLAVARVAFLFLSGANIQTIVSKVNLAIEEGGIGKALDVCKRHVSATSNVIAATLRNITKDREHIEDIISESIIHESARIDRFGASIMVIASVSPLLGLLGTVTGMISTFDIITEHGTGDPKLLSSGISEALVTTKFGLVVAIPMLLIGTILSSWGQRIKSELEQAALHMINRHKM